jgi:hypothetical protein
MQILASVITTLQFFNLQFAICLVSMTSGTARRVVPLW